MLRATKVHRLAGCDGAKPRGGGHAEEAVSTAHSAAHNLVEADRPQRCGTAVTDGCSSRGRWRREDARVSGSTASVDEDTREENAANPMTGSGMQQARSARDGRAVEVVNKPRGREAERALRSERQQHLPRMSVEGRKTPREATGRDAKHLDATGQVRGTNHRALRCEVRPRRNHGMLHETSASALAEGSVAPRTYQGHGGRCRPLRRNARRKVGRPRRPSRRRRKVMEGAVKETNRYGKKSGGTEP